MTNFSLSPALVSLPLRKINDEVFMATDEVVRFDSLYVDFVKQNAAKNARGRARICAHRGPLDTLHEMLIAIRSDSYIRPHRHHQKIESFHLVDGSVDVVIFEDDGAIADVVELSTDGNFYYRLDSPRYHTLLVHSPVLVIHEITNGPFDLNMSDFAPFSPMEEDSMVSDYIDQLKLQVRTWKEKYDVKTGKTLV
ncbi:WbuC family cupin fold metalloprotein [Amylibacter sp.]|jgi:cupin fold WbuC family metalloprotein|nr:WbuC family cupin fold metalloprotein [Amylibacter sp.]